MIGANHARAVRQQDRAADDVFQLADIAGPGMGFQQSQRRVVDPAGLFRRRRMAQQHPESERGNIPRPVAQGGQPQGEHVKPVKQVFAEPPGFHFGRKVPIGGCHHPHINLDRTGRAQRQNFAFLQSAQQLGLQRQRQFANFVEQQRALVSGAEQAFPGVGRAGERAFLVPEQQGFQHRFGHGGAIDRDKRPGLARGQAVDELRQHFLAGAGRPFEQDGNLALRNPFRQRQQRQRLRITGNRPAALRRRGDQGRPRARQVLRIIGQRHARRRGQPQRRGGCVRQINRDIAAARDAGGHGGRDALAKHDPVTLPAPAHQRHGNADQRLMFGITVRSRSRRNGHYGPFWSCFGLGLGLPVQPLVLAARAFWSRQTFAAQTLHMWQI